MQGRDSNAAPALHPSPLCPLHLNRPKSVKDVPGLKCQPCARLHSRGNDEPWKGGTKPMAAPNRSLLIVDHDGSPISLSERYWMAASVSTSSDHAVSGSSPHYDFESHYAPRCYRPFSPKYLRTEC